MSDTKRKKPIGKRALLIYFPEAVIRDLKAAAEREDTDCSKLIRKAVREKLEKQPA
jgi:5'-deoxynucleotidase YfbR-like HD superfamily hydrolase